MTLECIGMYWAHRSNMRILDYYLIKKILLQTFFKKSILLCLRAIYLYAARFPSLEGCCYVRGHCNLNYLGSDRSNHYKYSEAIRGGNVYADLYVLVGLSTDQKENWPSCRKTKVMIFLSF